MLSQARQTHTDRRAAQRQSNVTTKTENKSRNCRSLSELSGRAVEELKSIEDFWRSMYCDNGWGRELQGHRKRMSTSASGSGSGNNGGGGGGGTLKHRLLVVANRLPVSATRSRAQRWDLEFNAGGLVSALIGVKQTETRWIGWAGVNVPHIPGQIALTKALHEKCCIPVFLDEETVHQYYNGYCNNVLWPLLHYLGLPQEDRLAATHSLESQFESYKMSVNIIGKEILFGAMIIISCFFQNA